MNRKDGLKLARGACHVCAPKEWRHTPAITGDYDMDETILHRNNKDLPHRLELYVKGPKGAYGPKTGYNGYHSYSGDD